MIGTTLRLHKRHEVTDWLAGAAQALEEFHLVAWARHLGVRERFGLEMAWYLGRMAQSQTVVLAGNMIRDLDGFCRQLEQAMPHTGRIKRTIEGRGGVIDHLRRRPAEPAILGEVGHIKHRFYVWRDADVLLKMDAPLFGTIVDALTGVAAQAEYSDEDRLLIHRCVFVGGPALDLYAGDERGQFRCWLSDGRAEPLWTTITGVSVPPVMLYEVE